ncbi:MAG: RNA methyltransferase [Bacteroidales bacterium]|nr:RNA methyltransferase [Bacteroidales bacterium]
MNRESKQALLEYLSGFISENKQSKFNEIIKNRTRYLTVVLEDIYQAHNASAVLRSCDCFGIQDVHIIENQNTYEVNPDVALGSSKWLNLIKYNDHENNTPLAIRKLKDQGYRIIATTPHKNDVDLQQLDLNKGPVALVFGTEMRGLTDDALALADQYMKIPMYGFTESFNISVSAALSLFYLSEKLRNSEINWRLGEDEQLDIKLDWTRQVIKKCDLIEQQFLKDFKVEK